MGTAPVLLQGPAAAHIQNMQLTRMESYVRLWDVKVELNQGAVLGPCATG
jgi:hypothetical protein